MLGTISYHELMLVMMLAVLILPALSLAILRREPAGDAAPPADRAPGAPDVGGMPPRHPIARRVP